MELADISPYKAKSTRHPGKEYGFKDKSVFVKWLDYWCPWMMNFRDTDHMLLNRMRQIIGLWAGTDNLNITPQKMQLEISLGRFSRYNVQTSTNRDGKEVKKWPRPPWKASKKDIRFVDSVLPSFVRLPNSMRNGKMPAYFSDTLTIEDAVLFFSGLGKLILGLLTSIKRPQRMAFDALLTATEHLLMPVHFKNDLLGRPPAGNGESSNAS